VGNLFYYSGDFHYTKNNTAIVEDVDVFVTGDDDFDDVAVEKPEILTPAEFIKKY
jgi:predicted nucleic acid-binding protein